MSVDGFSNAYSTTLNGAIDNSQTSLVVTSATGAPSTVPFRLRIRAEGANTNEIVTVTAVSGTTFTVTRASESYSGVQTASAHASGATVEHVLTAGGLLTLASATAFIGGILSGTSLACSDNSTAVMPFTSEVIDTDGFHSTSSNTSRVTIPAGMGGRYLFIAGVSWPQNANGDRQVYITKNGTGTRHQSYMRSAVNWKPRQTVSEILDLIPGDYVEGVIGQDSGGSLTTEGYSLEWVKLDSGKVGQGIGARVTNTAATTVTDNTAFKVPFATEDFDTDGFHDNSTNNTRLTIPAGLGGKYILTGSLTYNTSNLQNTYAAITKNGSTYLTYTGRYAGVASGAAGHNVAAVVDLISGDYIELEAYQNSGSGKNLEGTAGFNWLAIARIDSGSSSLSISGGYNVVADQGAASLLTRRAAANAEDDHFNSATLDSKWLAYTGYDASTDLTVLPGWCKCTSLGYKLQAVPAGDWTIETEIIVADTATGAYQNEGLIMTNGTNSASSTDARYGIGHNNSLKSFRFEFEKFVNNSYSSTYDDYSAAFPPIDHYFLRIVKVGTTYAVEMSSTGKTWHRQASTSSLGFTPTHFGFGTEYGNSYFNYFLRY